MEQNDTFVARYSLADVFDRSFAMIRRTWKTSLTVGALSVIVPSVLLGWGAVRMLKAMAVVAEGIGPDPGAEVIWTILRTTGVMPLFGVVAGLAYLFAHLVVVDAVRTEAADDRHTVGKSISRVLRSLLLPVIGQMVLKAVLFGAIIGVPVALLVLAITLFDAGAGIIALVVLLHVAAVALTIWLYVALMFSTQSVVFDDSGAFTGLSRSMQLVRHNWWRIFGYYLLIQIVVSFLLGVISTPLVGISLIPGMSRIVEMATSPNVTDAEMVNLVASFSRLGLPVAVAAFVQQVLSLVFLPVVYSLLFIDLKVRSGQDVRGA